MKAILICPAERSEVAALAEKAPLANLVVMGKPVLFYWIEHLVAAGATELRVLAADRPEQVRALVGDGTRWGVCVSVCPVMRELSPHEVRVKYRSPGDTDWLMAPEDVVLMDHLPGQAPHALFASYASFYQQLVEWMPRAALALRVGVKEIQPGVWVGLNASISSKAKLIAPCWIGNHVRVGAQAVAGPGAIIEDHAALEPGVTVERSLVGAGTMAGPLVLLHESLAYQNRLLNWRTNSQVEVPDRFLLCGIEEQATPLQRHCWHGRLAAFLLLLLSAPLVLARFVWARVRREPALVACQAVRPEGTAPTRTIRYYEWARGRGWWKRWPQLWSIARGEFAWFGNPPLGLREANQLRSDFERLWFHAPIGFFTAADAAGCREPVSDETIAHSVYYATQGNARLRFEIFCGIALRHLHLTRAVQEAKAPSLKRSALALEQSAAR
jgi:hypothetical protein